MSKSLIVFLLFFISLSTLQAQLPKKPTASEIYESIKKLNFLGSVLYVAAHPDDENTRLISHLANDVKARTAYISITRGDGGQNLIGKELGPLLGVIRTNELQEARKIDGGEQFFTRAIDFGYSKNPEETFSIWQKNQVLSDLVLAIRKFKPDVIINRFNHRTPGTTHGHHTASAILSLEAFEKASNQNSFPQQLNNLKPWQPTRLFFNTSWWFYGSQEKFEKADKSNLISLNTGQFYPSLGLSNGEIAALSRSQHQSQGFGNTGSRGDQTEYLEIIKGSLPKDPNNLFDGIDTNWTRIEGGKEIGEILHRVERDFDFKNPVASIPQLITAFKLLKNRTDYWGIQKTKEIKEIIAACSGLFLEAVTESQYTAPNSTITIHVEAINRAPVSMRLNKISYGGHTLLANNEPLIKNTRFEKEYPITIPSDAVYSSPYWLKEKGTVGLYAVSNPEKIGLPTINENQPLQFKLTIEGEEFIFEKHLVYKFNSPVTGEVYQPFQVLPEITGKINQKVFIFEDNAPKNVSVTIKAGKNQLSGTVALQHPEGWKVSSPQSFKIDQKDQERDFVFKVTPPENQHEGTLKLAIQINDNTYHLEKITLDYNHIPYQHILLPAEAKVARIPIETKGQNIGYIAGAGDEIPSALSQIGYTVKEINLEAMTLENLIGFDAIVVGIRAYNIHELLKFRQKTLFEYVKEGGNLILQYNVSRGLVTNQLAPFELQLARGRVTNENAPVKFIDPKHPVLNTPNKLSTSDFEGWVQERGLYFAEDWSKEFTPIFKMNDPDEKPLVGSLLIAKHGKGNFIYTGLSFFRQLPAGVSGAYRLFANLLSLKNE